MRSAAQRRLGSTLLEEGSAVRGYVIDAVSDEHVGSELRYLVRGRDGEEATLITTRRPATDRRGRARFRRLASLRLKLDHPAALEAHAFGEQDGHLYLITDAYPARTFGDVLEDEAPLPPEQLLALLVPVAHALDRAHASGLVHRRLDADSLRVGHDGRLRLDSFGLLAEDEGTAWSGPQSADVRHRPPELALGEQPRPESNVYSLAAMMVHALTGAPPFGGDRGAATYAHAMEAPPRVTDRVVGVPAAVDDVVAWGMAKQPDARPRTATELLRAAEAALGTRVVTRTLGEAPAPLVPAPASPGSSAPPRSAGRAPHRRALAALAAAVAVAAAAGALAAVAIDPFEDDSPVAPARSAETGVWERVADRRVELREALSAAATPQEQAAAARELAGVYDGAAESARPSRVTGAARSAAAAYMALADAAEAGDEAAYAEAGEAVTAAERRFASAPR